MRLNTDWFVKPRHHTNLTVARDRLAKLLLDPFGGYFTHDIAVRRAFFLYRTTLIKSLWNLSMVEKGEIIFEKISSQMEKATPPKKTEK